MKTITATQSRFIYAVMGTLILMACNKSAQLDAVQVPDVVRTAFTNAYPSARSVDWSIEGEDYEVEFRDAGYEKEIVYDRNGIVLIVETDISFLALPQITQDYIGTNYPNYKIEDVERVESKNGRFYSVELARGDEEIELTFDEMGAFLEEKVVDEEDDADK